MSRSRAILLADVLLLVLIAMLFSSCAAEPYATDKQADDRVASAHSSSSRSQ